MNAVKFISFEMRLEFEIGETDYHVVWSSDKGKKQEQDTDEADEETKEKDSTQTNVGILVKSDEEETKEVQTDLANLEEKEKAKDIEDSTKKSTIENEKVFGQQTDVFRESWGFARLPEEKNDILEKEKDDDSTAVNIGSDDDKQDDVQQITNKNVNEENSMEEENYISEEPMVTRENGFIAGIELFMKRGTDGKTETDDNQNDMDQTDDLKANEKNSQEDETVSGSESPEGSSNVTSTLPAKKEEEKAENEEDDVRQYILEIVAGPRKIILDRKSSESSSPVFGLSTEGLDPEEMKNFGEAWAEAVFLCLERRVAVGHTLDEVLQGMVEELGLDKFQEIVEHFFGGSMTVEQMETEDEPDQDFKEANDEQN